MLSYTLASQLWGLLLNFDWLVHLIKCPNASTTNCNYRKYILYIIIGNVHNFIGHCPIPLDPWVIILTSSSKPKHVARSCCFFNFRSSSVGAYKTKNI